MFIQEFDDFVNRQIAYHDRKAKGLKGHPSAAMHVVYADTFRRLRAHCLSVEEALRLQDARVEELQNSTRNLPDTSDSFAITQDDLTGLPKELLDQLNLPQLDIQEKIIVDLVNTSGKVSSLDKILIGLYRQTKEVPQKRTINQKIFRMIDKGLLWKVPRKKGIYTTIPVAKSDADADAGNDGNEMEDK